MYETLSVQEAEDKLQEMRTSLSLLRHPVTRTEGVNEIPMPRLKFRFTDDQVNKLVNLIAVPDGVLEVGEPGKQHNYRATCAMQCLLLKLSSAGTQDWMAMALGTQPARVCEAAFAMACHIHTKYAERLNDLSRFAPLIAQSAKILREKGAPSMPASGDDDEVPARWPVFCLDGKLFPISRPHLTQDQNSILHQKQDNRIRMSSRLSWKLRSRRRVRSLAKLEEFEEKMAEMQRERDDAGNAAAETDAALTAEKDELASELEAEKQKKSEILAKLEEFEEKMVDVQREKQEIEDRKNAILGQA